MISLFSYHITRKVCALLLLSVVALLLQIDLKGQISQGGLPYSLRSYAPNSFRIASLMSAQVSFNNIDNAAELERADKIKRECSTCRNSYYGTGIDTQLDIKKEGKKYLLDEGVLWKLNVKSIGALGLQFYFDYYRLPPGASLYLYNSNNQVLGAFTSRNNHIDNTFATQLLPGEAATIEYFEPFNVTFQGELSIYKVIHAFRSSSQFGDNISSSSNFGDSWPCHEDISCHDSYDNVKNAIARISYYNSSDNLTGHCTGYLINSTDPLKPSFLMTASHCLGSSNPSPTTLLKHRFNEWVIEFDYDRDYCNSTFDPFPRISTNGARLLTRSNLLEADFALFDLEILNFADLAGVPYLGFDRAASQSQQAVGIHHAAGDTKKISFTNNFSEVENRWEVHWFEGLTQGGSSGSPLILNSNNRVIGLLSAGSSNCNSESPDFYSQFEYMWDTKDPMFLHSLSYFLDHQNQNISNLPGYFPDMNSTGGVFGGGCSNIVPYNNAPEVGIAIQKLGFSTNLCNSDRLSCFDSNVSCDSWKVTHGKTPKICGDAIQFDVHSPNTSIEHSGGIVKSFNFEQGKEYIISYQIYGGPSKGESDPKVSRWKLLIKSNLWTSGIDCGYFAPKASVGWNSNGLVSQVERSTFGGWATYASRFKPTQNADKLLIIHEADHTFESALRDVKIFLAEDFEGGSCSTIRNITNAAIVGDVYAKNQVNIKNSLVSGNVQVQSPHIVFKDGFKIVNGNNLKTKNGKCYVSDNPNSPTQIPNESAISDQLHRYRSGSDSLSKSLYVIRDFDIYSSTEQVLEQGFKIYPNPSPDGVIKLESTSDTSFGFEIYSLNGARLMKSKNIQQTSVDLNLSSFSNSVFIIKIMDANGGVFLKRIKKS